MNASTYPQNQTISPPDGHWLRYLTSWLQSSENFQPQWHASTRNTLCENSTKPLKRFSSLSDDVLAGVCEATKKVAILLGVVSHLRAQNRTSDSRDPKADDHLINLRLPATASPAPSRTEWWVKWLPTLRLHLEKASLSPFVCYFCLFVCREHAYLPKEDDSVLISWEMKEGLRLSGLSAWIKMWFSNAITLNCSSITISLGSGNSFRWFNPLWSWGMAESSFHLSRLILILMLLFKIYGYLFIPETGNVAIKSGRRLWLRPCDWVPRLHIWVSMQTSQTSVIPSGPH